MRRRCLILLIILSLLASLAWGRQLTFPGDLQEQLELLGYTPLTPGQIAALAGTNGTPSGSNKFVTNSDPRNSDARTPTAHGSSAHNGIIGSWAQIDKTTSNLGDLTTKSHTSLTDIGTHSHAEIDGLFNGGSAITGLYCYRNDGVPAVEIKGTGDTYNYSAVKLSSDEATNKYWAWIHRKYSDLPNGLVLEYFDGTNYTQPCKIKDGKFGWGRAPDKFFDINGYLRGNGIFNLKNDAPADADLAAGECCWWYDKTDGAAKVMFKAKTNNGTVVAGSLTLN